MTDQPTPAEAMAREAIILALDDCYPNSPSEGCVADLALDRALTLARTQGALEALTMMPCVANVDGRGVCSPESVKLATACPRCWRKAEAQADFDAAVKAVEDHG